MKRKPLVIIVSAPSGSGKTTIVSRLLDKMTGLSRSISCTTREPREGEGENKDYIFITREEFLKKAERDEFLEWEENFGHYYGTPAAQMEEALAKGEDYILSIDVKGARTIREKIPESVSVFIMPPSADELRARLKRRKTDKESDMSLRLKESEREMSAADEYDYLIVNETLDKAVKELETIIEKERKMREKETKER